MRINVIVSLIVSKTLGLSIPSSDSLDIMLVKQLETKGMLVLRIKNAYPQTQPCKRMSNVFLHTDSQSKKKEMGWMF